jgi:CDP-diglyceride synthetase
MNWSVLVRNLTVRGAFAGAALGLLAGLLLVWLTDSVDNPFWVMSIGIAVGTALATAPAVRRDLDKG